MTLRCLLPLLALACSISWPAIAAANERIWLQAAVNGTPARFIFDSGSCCSAVWPNALEKFRLRFIPDPTNVLGPGARAGRTEVVNLTLEGAHIEMSFSVLDPPNGLESDFEGLIGWRDLRRKILNIDAFLGTLTLLHEVPKEAAQWTCLCFDTNSTTLDLQIPIKGSSNRVLCVDTGMSEGVTLSRADWHRWKEAHPQTPTTFEARYIPADGVSAAELAWADKVSIGPIVLTNVPITEASPALVGYLGNRYAGGLGLAALKQLNLVVDGRKSLAYVSTRMMRPNSYPHNRLGAAFVPSAAHTNDFVARVADASPASEAGIRDGDLLLRVDNLGATNLQGSWTDKFYEPAGTKLKITLSRDGKPFTTTATLRDILQPTESR